MNLFKKIKNLDKYTKLAIIVIIIAGLVRFFLALIYHVSGDACWHFSAGRFIAENGKVVPEGDIEGFADSMVKYARSV